MGLRTLSYRTLFTGLVLLLAIAAEAGVLYFSEDRNSRIGLGLLLLAVIMWTSAKLGLAERLTGAVSRQFKVRRYLRLRTVIDEFITSARLLHGLKLDMEQGRRQGESARLELEKLEKRLDELAEEVKRVAGPASQD